MRDGLQVIAELTPAPPDWGIDWEAVRRSELGLYAGAMERTPQNPVYHGEGDVWTHTRLVCQALAGMDAFRALPEMGRQALFAAALLHDVGKTRTTRWEDGRWTSPGHAAVGERMVRELLWTGLGLCGTAEKIALREAVCGFVRRHGMLVHGADGRSAGRKLRETAELGSLAPEFTLERLCLLAEADARGKICADAEDQLEGVAMCALLAEEMGCAEGPYPFPDGHTRQAYLSGRGTAPDYPLYDDRWGPVVVLAGLPGAGKDTWIRRNMPGAPQVSLDGIRRELGVGPTENQGAVAEEARRRARVYLRRREPFVWNATDVTSEARRRPLELARDYGAWVRLVYLETDLEEDLRRNRERDARVPEDVICGLIGKLAMPVYPEAREILWLPG